MDEKFIKALYLTYENAKSLFEEAEILEEKRKVGRAYTLYHLCFEECGRFHLINKFLGEYFSGEIKAKELNYGNLKKRGFENHNLKISENFKGIYFITYLSLYAKSKIDLIEDFENEYKIEIEKITNQLNVLLEQENELNRLKNVGLYVTFNNNNFNLPDDAIMTSAFLQIKNLAVMSLNVVKKIIDYAENKGGFDKLKELHKEGK